MVADALGAVRVVHPAQGDLLEVGRLAGCSLAFLQVVAMGPAFGNPTKHEARRARGRADEIVVVGERGAALLLPWTWLRKKEGHGAT